MKSRLTSFALKLANILEQRKQISCGLYDLLQDMREDSTISSISKNKDTIEYLRRRLCNNPAGLERLRDLLDLYKNRKKIEHNEDEVLNLL